MQTAKAIQDFGNFSEGVERKGREPVSLLTGLSESLSFLSSDQRQKVIAIHL
jgi:hypothetical protein